MKLGGGWSRRDRKRVGLLRTCVFNFSSHLSGMSTDLAVSLKQYLQLVPPKPRPAVAAPAPPARRAPPAAPAAPSAPSAPSAPQSSRMADSNSAPVSVMPGMGNAGGLAAILAAKRAAADTSETSSSAGSTPASSRPSSGLGTFYLIFCRQLALIANSWLPLRRQTHRASQTWTQARTQARPRC